MPILNYTTTIQAEKTIGEISAALVKRGARKIVTDYDGNGQPVALTFVLPWKGEQVPFHLPVNYPGILAAMKRDKVPKAKTTAEQAVRVGWRIVREWVLAQCAMVDADILTLPQIFFSQAMTREGKTVYQLANEGPGRLLQTSGE